MAVHVIKDSRIYVGAYNLSGDVNNTTLAYDAEIQDNTCMSTTGARTKLPGLVTAVLDVTGLWDAGAGEPDTVLFSTIGGDEQVITVAPQSATAGNPGFSFKALHASYNPISGGVGEVMPFTLRAEGTGVLVRGTIMLNGAITATGTGTARNLGAVASGQSLYAAMHVIAASGTTPTLDMVVQSDDADTFLSPTDRITFTQATGITSEWKSAAGPITDTWFRLSWTIAGTTPSFTVIVNLGIK